MGEADPGCAFLCGELESDFGVDPLGLVRDDAARELFADSTRYSDFQRSLGIATNILKARLDGFVDAGIMRRQQYSEQPALYEYLLTEKGRDFAPTLIALTEWGDRWAAPDGPPILYHHSVCDSEVSHEVVCATCGPVADPAEVRALPGPGMPADRAETMNKRIADRSGSLRVATS